MKTIIAEKPSVAREIARIVGATKREEGYFEGGGYAVTWAFGHLVQLIFFLRRMRKRKVSCFNRYMKISVRILFRFVLTVITKERKAS